MSFSSIDDVIRNRSNLRRGWRDQDRKRTE
jgi:hypothetical protein